MIRVALIIIANKNQQVLLQHRDENAPTNPNKWGIWGGGIEKEETSTQAAVRELKEELDINVEAKKLEPFKVYRDRYFGDDWEGSIFLLQDNGEFDYRLVEGDDFRFCSMKECQKMDVDPVASRILQDYFSKLTEGSLR